MAFICTAVFGLFCLSAPEGKTQIEANRFKSVTGLGNGITIKAANWQADFAYSDHPDTTPGEFIINIEPDFAKTICRDGQCIRYEAFCRDKPPTWHTSWGEYCSFGFQVGKFLGADFATFMQVRATNKSAVDDAMQSFSYVKQTDNAPKIVLPLSELKLTMNPPCPKRMCPEQGRVQKN